MTADTRGNQTGWAGPDRREFAFAAPGSYKKYRLNEGRVEQTTQGEQSVPCSPMVVRDTG
ncbi:hypothetical protein ACN469_24400 [Corallococcus terminator]